MCWKWGCYKLFTFQESKSGTWGESVGQERSRLASKTRTCRCQNRVFTWWTVWWWMKWLNNFTMPLNWSIFDLRLRASNQGIYGEATSSQENRKCCTHVFSVYGFNELFLQKDKKWNIIIVISSYIHSYSYYSCMVRSGVIYERYDTHLVRPVRYM